MILNDFLDDADGYADSDNISIDLDRVKNQIQTPGGYTNPPPIPTIDEDDEEAIYDQPRKH